MANWLTEAQCIGPKGTEDLGVTPALSKPHNPASLGLFFPLFFFFPLFISLAWRNFFPNFFPDSLLFSSIAFPQPFEAHLPLTTETFQMRGGGGRKIVHKMSLKISIPKCFVIFLPAWTWNWELGCGGGYKGKPVRAPAPAYHQWPESLLGNCPLVVLYGFRWWNPKRHGCHPCWSVTTPPPLKNAFYPS